MKIPKCPLKETYHCHRSKLSSNVTTVKEAFMVAKNASHHGGRKRKPPNAFNPPNTTYQIGEIKITNPSSNATHHIRDWSRFSHHRWARCCQTQTHRQMQPTRSEVEVMFLIIVRRGVVKIKASPKLDQRQMKMKGWDIDITNQIGKVMASRLSSPSLSLTASLSSEHHPP